MSSVYLPAFADLVVRWILFMVAFLIISAVFRERFEVEGMIGYLWVLMVIAPVNVVAPFYLQEMQILPAPGILEIWLKLFLLSAAIVYALSKFLPGLATEGHVAPFLVSALLAAVATGLFLMPEIPALSPAEM